MIYGPGRRSRKDFFRVFRWAKEYQQLAEKEGVMAWEQEKDNIVHEVGFVKLSDKEDLHAAIYSYNGGPLKIGVNRKIRTRQGTTTGALRRMTRDEARVVAKLLTEAADRDSFWEGK